MLPGKVASYFSGGTVELGILKHVQVEMIRPRVNACIIRKNYIVDLETMERINELSSRLLDEGAGLVVVFFNLLVVGIC